MIYAFYTHLQKNNVLSFLDLKLIIDYQMALCSLNNKTAKVLSPTSTN